MIFNILYIILVLVICIVIYFNIRENEHSLSFIIITGIIATIIGNLLIPSNISVFDIIQNIKVSSTDIPNNNPEEENEQIAINDDTPAPSTDIVAEIWLYGQNLSDCPQIKLPQKLEITDSTYYEMTWEPFEGVNTYKISIWKDLNYGTSDSNVIPIGEIEVNGLSYIIDFNTLEYGCVYGFNVVSDNHYSAPLLVELHSPNY